jgi:hypothetical protein
VAVVRDSVVAHVQLLNETTAVGVIPGGCFVSRSKESPNSAGGWALLLVQFDDRKSDW